MSQDLSPTVSWDLLHHHYGTAEDIPELLRTAATDRAAFGDLDNKISHQGGSILSAAPPVLPILVRWAADPAVGHRNEVIELIGRLAYTAARARPEFVTPTWPPAWDTAVPELLGLLAHPDPVVRRMVAFPLAQARDHAALVLSALHARWQEEPDEATRLGLVLAAAHLLRDMVAEWPHQTVAWLTGLRQHPNAAHRFAGAMAHRLSGLGGRDPWHVDEAESYLVTADRPLWHQVWCTRGRVDRLVWWTNDVLDADRDGRTRLAATLLATGDDAALRAAAQVMNRWRSPVPTLLPLVAARLADRDPGQRREAAEILGGVGRAAAPWRAELVAAAADDEPKVAKAALHALVTSGAPEAVGLVADLLDHRSAQTILVPLRKHAAELLPVVERGLREADCAHARDSYLRVVAEWGAEAQGAFPAVVALLGTDAEQSALDALIALGSAEARAAALPAVVAARSDSVRAATRYWRLTGEPEPLLSLISADDATLRQNAYILAELGPAAARLTDRLRSQITSGWKGWGQASIAYALWRMTGESSDAFVAVVSVRRTLAVDQNLGGYAIRHLQNLVSLGPLAAGAVPALRSLLDQDVRPVLHDRLCGVATDDLLCDMIRAIMAASSA